MKFPLIFSAFCQPMPTYASMPVKMRGDFCATWEEQYDEAVRANR